MRKPALRGMQCLLRMLPFDDLFAQFFIGTGKLGGAFLDLRFQFIVRLMQRLLDPAPVFDFIFEIEVGRPKLRWAGKR